MKISARIQELLELDLVVRSDMGRQITLTKDGVEVAIRVGDDGRLGFLIQKVGSHRSPNEECDQGLCKGRVFVNGRGKGATVPCSLPAGHDDGHEE